MILSTCTFFLYVFLVGRFLFFEIFRNIIFVIFWFLGHAPLDVENIRVASFILKDGRIFLLEVEINKNFGFSSFSS